jgi:hypothetical protein
MVGDFYGRFQNKSSSFRKKMTLNSFIVEQIMRIIWGEQTADNGINAIIRRLKLPLPVVSGVGQSLLANIMVELFSESNPENKDFSKSLPGLGERLLIYLTGHEDPRAMSLIKAPLLDAIGSVERTYLELRKLAREVDSFASGDWPLILRNMTLPLSDAIFIDRASDTTSRAVATVAKHLIERLKVLTQFPQLLVTSKEFILIEEGSPLG